MLNKYCTMLKFNLIGVMLASLCVYGCTGTPKVSKWISPPDRQLTASSVFDTAIFAGTENKFVVISSDRQAGIISMKQESYGGDHKNDEVRMSVRLKELSKNSVEVRTKVSSSGWGLVEWLLGGAVHGEITNNFYVDLFNELKITDPAQRKYYVVDEKKSSELDLIKTSADLR